MDWTIPLKSQQADFIARLADSNRAAIVRCDRPGCYSEGVTVTADRLKELRARCRQLVLQSDPSLPVRQLLAEYLHDQLARLAIAPYLRDLVVPIDPLRAIEGGPPMDYTLKERSQIGIRVKGANGDPQTVRWSVTAEDLRHNAAIVCVSLTDEAIETLGECHLVQGGFIPTAAVELQGDRATLKMEDLLYGSGLKSYLESLRSPDRAPRKSRKWLRPLTGSSNYLYPLAIASDGRTLATSSYDGSITLWHLEGSQLRQALGGQSWFLYPAMQGTSPQSLTGSQSDQKLNLWLSESGEPIVSLSGHTSGVSAIAIGRDRATLVSGGYDGTIKIWQLPQGRLRQTLTAHASTVRPLAISPDGKILASASIDNSLKFWRVETGEAIRSFTNRTDPVVALAVSPDSKTLASGSQNGLVELWDLETGEKQRTLFGHAGAIAAMTVSDDGRVLASSSTERTVKLWDTQTGELRETLTGHPDPLVTVAPNPNGHWLDLNLFSHPQPGWDRK